MWKILRIFLVLLLFSLGLNFIFEGGGRPLSDIAGWLKMLMGACYMFLAAQHIDSLVKDYVKDFKKGKI